mgnify:CR=1 FL=1
MQPFWRWVGIGILVALSVAWITEFRLTTFWQPSDNALADLQRDLTGNVGATSPQPRVRMGKQGASVYGCLPAGVASTVIIEGSQGATQRLSVLPGQTVVVGQDGTVRVSDDAAAAGCDPAQFKQQAMLAAQQAKERTDQAARQAKELAMQQAQRARLTAEEARLTAQLQSIQSQLSNVPAAPPAPSTPPATTTKVIGSK